MTTTNVANDSVNDDTWYWILIEFIVFWFLLYGIQELNRLPRLIYLNTTLFIITFIVCAIFIYVVEYGDHDWFYLVKFPLIPGAVVICLMFRVNAISMDETIKPYLDSVHFWLKYPSNKLFGNRYGAKGFAWFAFILLWLNIAAAVVDEITLNSHYVYNSINGILTCCSLATPLCNNTIVAKTDGSSYHDLSWSLDIGWITLYSLWHTTYIAFKYSDALTVHIAIITVAYVRGLVNKRNDLWIHARIITLSVIVFWRMPISFRFSRWFLHYAPWQKDETENDQLMNVFEWISFCVMIYAALYFMYAMYASYKLRKRHLTQKLESAVHLSAVADDSDSAVPLV